MQPNGSNAFQPSEPGLRRLAIFDIDGTLIDSVHQHQAAFIHALDKLGFSGYSTEWHSYPHHTDVAIFKAIFEQCAGIPAAAADISRFEQLVAAALANLTSDAPVCAMKDVLRFLRHIRQRYDVVFATGSLLQPALMKLAQAGLQQPAELIVACNEYCSREEILLAAVERAKDVYRVADYTQIVSFGDGLWDYRTARNLGIAFIGIGNRQLASQGARHCFSDFSDDALYRLTTPMEELAFCPDFEIRHGSAISAAFLVRGLTTFRQAMDFIRHLPYGRNANKGDLTTVFTDSCGTCSTKHALLAQLASEQGFPGLQLVMGLFRMNSQNMPAIAGTLSEHRLGFIPEAHVYLKYEGAIIDCTNARAGLSGFADELMEETEIQPDQIGEFKVAYHKAYLERWLCDNPAVGYSLADVWAIREQCICDISRKVLIVRNYLTTALP